MLAAFLAVLFPRESGASVSFNFFYDNLSSHGEWVETDGYGYCWRPSGMDEEWAPYTDGYWAYTDAGWTWVSYEDFGPITYHYGRWVRLDRVGWIWKPDYEWAPAWVSWRYSDDYVGWAPLPPEARWDAAVGISVWADRDYNIGPGYYSFCETRHFGAPVLRNVIVRRSHNVTIINKTVNITNITVNKHKSWVYNGGPDYRKISAKSNRRIETLKLERRTDWDRRRDGKMSRPQRVGNGLVVEAPVIDRSEQPGKPPRVSRRIEKAKVDKGWDGIADPTVRRKIEEKMRDDTKGLSRKNAPARPVDEKTVEEVIASNSSKNGKADRRSDRNQNADPRRNRDDKLEPFNPGRTEEARGNQRPERSNRPDSGERNKTSTPEPQRVERVRGEDESRRQREEKPSREQEQARQVERARRDGEEQRQRDIERERQRDQQRQAEQNARQQQQMERARRDGEQQRQRDIERERQRDQQRQAEQNARQQQQMERARRDGEQQRQRDAERQAERNFRQQRQQMEGMQRDSEKKQRRENDRNRSNDQARFKQEKRSSAPDEGKGKKKRDDR